MTRIGVFDDHDMIVEGLKSLFLTQSGFEISFHAKNKQELYDALKSSVIDVLIVDVLAPDVSGLEHFETINSIKNYKIIAYSTLRSAILVDNLIKLDVDGFVSKNSTNDKLLEAINEVTSGKKYFPEEFKFLTSQFRISENNKLTDRELDIVKLVAKEFSTKEIASELGVAISTVENHRTNVFKKFDVKNSVGMVLVASKLGYL